MIPAQLLLLLLDQIHRLFREGGNVVVKVIENDDLNVTVSDTNVLDDTFTVKSLPQAAQFLRPTKHWLGTQEKKHFNSI